MNPQDRRLDTSRVVMCYFHLTGFPFLVILLSKPRDEYAVFALNNLYCLRIPG